MNDTIGRRIELIVQKTTKRNVRFAEAIGIDQSYVSQLISGRRTPGDRTIRDICNEFNVNEDWLRNGGDDSRMFNPAPDTDETVIQRILDEFHLGSPVFRTLAETYLRLDEPHRKAFDEIVAQFVAAYQAARPADSQTPAPTAVPAQISAPPAPPADPALTQSGTVYTGGHAVPLYNAAPDADLHARHAARQERHELAEAEADEYSPIPGSRYPVLNDEP